MVDDVSSYSSPSSVTLLGLFLCSAVSIAACGSKPAPPPSTPAPTPSAATADAGSDTTATAPAPAPAPSPAAPAADTSDPPNIPQDKMAAYQAIWRDYFAKENNITPEELDKRIAIKTVESSVRNFSRTFLEVKMDVTSEWASVHGATSEMLVRIKARSSDPPPSVRYDVWLEASDFTAMKTAKALITTKYNFGKLRFKKQADAEAATAKACKSKNRVHDFQIAIAGDGDPWLMSLFQNDKSKENWPCGVDLVKTKGGEIMNFDAGDNAFK